MQLDMKRAARIYGSSRAAFFQDGQYFTREGEIIPPELAGEPDPDDVANGVVKPAAPEVQEASPSYETIPAGPVAPVYDGIQEAPVAREANAKPWGEDTRQKLKGLSSVQLANMVMKLGGTPSTGYGAKKKNLAWLIENVRD